MAQKLGFGKYRDLTFAVVATEDKDYCKWVLLNYEKSKSPPMYNFGVWLREQEKQGAPPAYTTDVQNRTQALSQAQARVQAQELALKKAQLDADAEEAALARAKEQAEAERIARELEEARLKAEADAKAQEEAAEALVEAGAAVASAFIKVVAHGIRDLTTISLANFGTTLADGDVIQLRVSNGEPERTTFIITAARGLWAKKIRIIGAAGDSELVSDRGNSGTVASAALTSTTIEFWKPKFLGTFRRVYELTDLTSFVGKRVEFHWVRD